MDLIDSDEKLILFDKKINWNTYKTNFEIPIKINTKDDVKKEIFQNK